MLRRFGAWMYRYAVAIELAILVAGVLALVLNADGGFRGIEMAFWKSQAQACGLLSEYADGLRRGSYGDPQAATTCFMQAYAHCHAATLVESFSGVDTSNRGTFVIEPVLFAGGGHHARFSLIRPPGWAWLTGCLITTGSRVRMWTSARTACSSPAAASTATSW